MQTDNEIKIQQAIEAMLPDKLGNGLTRTQARILYMGAHPVTITDKGLMTKDRKLNDVRVEEHLQTYFGAFVAKKTEYETFTKNSEVMKYCLENNIPFNLRAGILAEAMKNEGFKINE